MQESCYCFFSSISIILFQKRTGYKCIFYANTNWGLFWGILEQMYLHYLSKSYIWVIPSKLWFCMTINNGFLMKYWREQNPIILSSDKRELKIRMYISSKYNWGILKIDLFALNMQAFIKYHIPYLMQQTQAIPGRRELKNTWC